MSPFYCHVLNKNKNKNTHWVYLGIVVCAWVWSDILYHGQSIGASTTLSMEQSLGWWPQWLWYWAEHIGLSAQSPPAPSPAGVSSPVSLTWASSQTPARCTVDTPAAFECNEIAPPAKRAIYKLVIDFQTSCLCCVSCRVLCCLPPTLLGTHNPGVQGPVMRSWGHEERDGTPVCWAG